MKVTVKMDENGEAYIELPPKIVQDLAWDDETSLMWVIHEDGTVYLRKSENDSSNEA
tara:strand:- start:12687 stop:12857 length:171 start_codon:yes stop_codon:yes gene_type:complete